MLTALSSSAAGRAIEPLRRQGQRAEAIAAVAELATGCNFRAHFSLDFRLRTTFHATVGRSITMAVVEFRPVSLAACDRRADEDPEAIAEHLAASRMALLRNALRPERRQQARSIAEREMPERNNCNFADVMSHGLGPINMSVLLYVLDSAVLDVARAYFRRMCGTSDMIIVTNGLMMRRMAAGDRVPENSQPWHQDAIGLPADFVPLNCWTLLSPDECGETAPGLDIIPDAIPAFLGMEAPPASAALSYMKTLPSAIAQYVDAYQPWRPLVRLGDVLIFDMLTLHRTGWGPEQRLPRISLELRLAARTEAVLAHIETSPSGLRHYHLQGAELTGPTHFQRMPDRSMRFWGDGCWTIPR